MKLKILFLDIDGVLTDGTKQYYSDGSVSKSFHDHDSAGIKLLLRLSDIKIILISADERVNKAWAKHQKLQFYKSADKLSTIKKIIQEYNVHPEETAFVGDDLRDFEAMNFIQLPICPSNACYKVKKLCHKKGIILKRSGGQGAVRELIQKLLKMKLVYLNHN